MSDPFLGEIRMVGFNFAPIGWALCQGQTMQIQQNAALFALLGTTYGGDGQTTFGLPDLRGRSPVGMGQGAGLTNIVPGEVGGAESLAILTSGMPMNGVQPGVAGGNLPAPIRNPYVGLNFVIALEGIFPSRG